MCAARRLHGGARHVGRTPLRAAGSSAWPDVRAPLLHPHRANPRRHTSHNFFASFAGPATFAEDDAKRSIVTSLRAWSSRAGALRSCGRIGSCASCGSWGERRLRVQAFSAGGRLNPARGSCRIRSRAESLRRAQLTDKAADGMISTEPPLPQADDEPRASRRPFERWQAASSSSSPRGAHKACGISQRRVSARYRSA